jgi:hypothetical protein
MLLEAVQVRSPKQFRYIPQNSLGVLTRKTWKYIVEHSVTHGQSNFNLMEVQLFDPPQFKHKELFFMFKKIAKKI